MTFNSDEEPDDGVGDETTCGDELDDGVGDQPTHVIFDSDCEMDDGSGDKADDKADGEISSSDSEGDAESTAKAEKGDNDELERLRAENRKLKMENRALTKEDAEFQDTIRAIKEAREIRAMLRTELQEVRAEVARQSETIGMQAAEIEQWRQEARSFLS